MSGNIILSAISDNSQLQISRKRKLSDDLEETFKHSISMNSLIGTLIVDYNDSSAYFSHSNCKGISCSCRNIAIKFLTCRKISKNSEKYSSFSGPESWLSDLEEDFIRGLSYPYLVILSHGCCYYLVTKYSASDHHIERLLDGNYFIK